MKKTLLILLGLVLTGMPTLGFSYVIDEAMLICELLNEKSKQPQAPIAKIASFEEFMKKTTIIGEGFHEQYENYKKKLEDQNNKSSLENQKIQMAAMIHAEKCTGSDFKQNSEQDQGYPVDQYKDQHE